MRTSDPAAAAVQVGELATPLASPTELMTEDGGTEPERSAGGERTLVLVVDTPATDVRPLADAGDTAGDIVNVVALPALAAGLERTVATLWASPVQTIELLHAASAQRRLLDTIALACEIGAAHLPASLAADLAAVRGSDWPRLLTTPPGPLALS